MNLLATVSSLAPLLAVFFSLHPIHVSVTEIEYDEKDRALEIMMRVFVDDLELTQGNGWDPNQGMKNQSGPHRHQLLGVAGEHQANIGS